MQAAQILAGYSLGGADLLRRAMGKKIKSEMDAQRATFVEGCADAQRHPGGKGQRAVRLDRQVRRLRLQQEPRRGLRAAHLPDGMAQGASPRRILRRIDELRRRADRQARDVRRGHAPRRCRVPAARHQRQPRSISRSRTAPSAMRWARSRASARRRWRHWSRSANGVGHSPASRISPLASIRDCSTGGSSKALPARERSTAIKPERAARIRCCRDDPRSRGKRTRPAHQRPGRAVRRQFGRGCSNPLPRDASWTHAQRMAAEREAFGFYFSAHPVDFGAPPARRAQSEDVRRDQRDADRRRASGSAQRWPGWSRKRAGGPRPRAAAT